VIIDAYHVHVLRVGDLLSVNFVNFPVQLFPETADKTNMSYINQSWGISEHYCKKLGRNTKEKSEYFKAKTKRLNGRRSINSMDLQHMF
jgi:hypothetical protein